MLGPKSQSQSASKKTSEATYVLSKKDGKRFTEKEICRDSAKKKK
jgi:hypothetical protein